MRKLFHIGLAVPELEKSMAEIGELFDLEWRPVGVATVPLVDSNGRHSEVDVRVTFSIPGPFARRAMGGDPRHAAGDAPVRVLASRRVLGRRRRS